MPPALPITVIIPAYNAAATIGDALAGIGAQTRQPARTIVVDDGSTDATARIARECGVEVISQRNRGVAAARNTGIRAAATPWIALLDADDRWCPDRLEAQWRLHELRPDVAVLATDYAFCIEGKLRPKAVMQSLGRYRRMRRDAFAGGSFVPRAELLRAILPGNFVLPSTMLLHRRVFSEFGTYFAETDRLPSGPEFFVGEDYEWLLRLLGHSDVLVAERVLVEYRRGAGTLSAPGGRLRYGDVKLGEFVCGRAGHYPRAASEAFRRLRPQQLREASLRYLAAGDVARARAMLREAQRTRADPGILMLLGLTRPLETPVGQRLFAFTLSTWRKRLRPLLRAGRFT